MSKVATYNTNSYEYPPQDRDVYHDRDDCSDGKKIKREHQEPWTGGKKRCKVCIDLSRGRRAQTDPPPAGRVQRLHPRSTATLRP